MSVYSERDLIDLPKAHDTLVAIDSDGCVFDSMGIKQRDCFHPVIIRHWSLEPIEPQLRETAEFVNLFSKSRGQNRFTALLRVFELLPKRADVKHTGVVTPPVEPLRAFVESEQPLTNTGLETELEHTGDPELERLLQWSLDVNCVIEEKVKNVPPFRWVREALDKISATSDRIVCSQTPEDALIREWKENGIEHFVSVIAGQELGTKAEHIKLASEGKYDSSNVLMIGDAPGDFKAAEANDALFFPVVPGSEETSWKRLVDEAYDRFVRGEYAGAYQDELLSEFDASLPEEPSWSQ
jgi:phosphoglycolate phosphatase-like HAD superfamily hydrolase